MKIPPVKGTRDFYPPEMAVRNWIVDGWKKVSVRNGFEEYDGPIFEYLKMFQMKSGDEIVEQLFSLKDRGGRDLAIRPEITPTLARMVNQQINSLPRPIKWFSVPRLCRAERPQKGRLREFFQWNIDVIGVDDVLADAEVIFTTVDYLREVGLTEKDVRVKFSSRKLLGSFLESLAIAPSKFQGLYALLDKKPKLGAETFNRSLQDMVGDAEKAAKIVDFMTPAKAFDRVVRALARGGQGPLADSAIELEVLLDYLELMGVGDYCEFDPSIVRGLAYYTGIVFEAHDTSSELRAICGGGRFDNLLRDFGGPPVPATGMGMGDCVLEILLREKGLLEKLPRTELDYFVFCVDKVASYKAVQLVSKLRGKGIPAAFSHSEPSRAIEVPPDQGGALALASVLREGGWKADLTYKSGRVTKQLKQPSAQRAKECIIIGQEFIEKNQLVLKDMATGEQREVDYDQFLAQLESEAK